jgi:hypothetical protein
MVEPIQPEPRLVLPVAAPTLTVTMPAKKNPLLAHVQQRALNDLPLFALTG